MPHLKIAVVWINYGPYHFARLGAFYNQCKEKNWEVVGIELARFEKTYDWRVKLKKFPYEFISLNENKVLEDLPLTVLLKQIVAIFSQINPDVIVVAGYSHPAMSMISFWGKFFGKKIILMSATKNDDFQRIWWRETIKSIGIKQFDAALVGGVPQRRYLLKLGLPHDAIFTGYNVVNNDIFSAAKYEYIKSTPLEYPYFLSINRFVPKKNLINLIDAYANYYLKSPKEAWHLVLCGSGELRIEIEDLIKKLGLSSVVHLPGFLQQDQLLPYFAHAKCFIHASVQEQWGLVVNEAMAAGLPVLVSNRCGCFEDLVKEGINGFGFNPEDQQQLTNLMLKMSYGEVDLEAMAQAGLNHIQNYSPDYFAQSLKQAVEFAINKKR